MTAAMGVLGWKTYALMAGLLAVTALVVALVARHGKTPARAWRNAALALTSASLLLPLLVLLLPAQALPRPRAQVWSGTRRATGETYAVVSAKTFSPASRSEWIVADRVLRGLALLWGMGFLTALARLLYQARRLNRVLRESHEWHTLGRVRVRISDSVASPFSASLGKWAYLIVPTFLVDRRPTLRLVVAHELQHHRQHDPQLVWFFEFLKAAFFWNPAIYALSSRFHRLQELACDAAVVDRRGITPQAYGRCLYEVAQSALDARRLPVGTTGMATSASGRFLKWRIEMVLKPKSPFPVVPVLAGSLLVLSALAIGAQSVVQARKLTNAQLQSAAKVAAESSAIPVVLNDLVAARVQRFAGTAEGRKRMKEGLQRMEQYRELVETKAAQYGLPKELAAIPLFESGYRNDLISADPFRGAGIWQFIAPTARRYGLRAVDKRAEIQEGSDDRLNPEKETDAAMRYLKDLHAQFQDWNLAIKAYNEGEGQVERLIAQHGTRDAWALEAKGSSEGYLPGAVAALILLKNPQLLD